MENDDKIKKPKIVDTNLLEAKKFFLGVEADELGKNLEQKKVYYLERELPKLKKNKNHLVNYLVIGFILFFFLISFLGVRIIKMQEGDIVVGIEDFASINLSEIIEKVKNYRASLEEVNDELKRHNLELKEKIRIIEEAQRVAIAILKKKNLDINQYRIEVSKIKKRTLVEKDAAKKEHSRKITPLINNKNEIVEKIAVIEKQEKFKEVKEQNVINEDVNKLTEVRIEKIKDDYQEKLNRKEKYYLNQKKKLELQFSKIIRQIHEKYGKQINDYQNGFNRYINELGNVGVVLNIINDKKVTLYIHPIYKVKRNTRAYVIDRKSKIKAEIIINKDDDYYEGIVNKTFNKEKVAALDNVILILQ